MIEHVSKMQSRVRPAILPIFMGSLALTVLLYSAGKTAETDEKLSKAQLMTQGKEIYHQTCTGCHQANGMGLPGSYPPLVDGAAFSASPLVTQPLEERGFWKNGKIQLGSVDNYIDTVINGIPGSRMFAFGGQLSDTEIAAVVTYERNAWGNNSGDVIQPAQVKAAR
jgi:cytochrome c oxidase subunit II